VVRDGALVALVTATGWVDATIQSGPTYTYPVSAYDNAANVSIGSKIVAIETSSNNRK